jgi:hypothetical protein
VRIRRHREEVGVRTDNIPVTAKGIKIMQETKDRLLKESAVAHKAEFAELDRSDPET